MGEVRKVKEKNATADEVIAELCSDDRYGIGTYTTDSEGTLQFTPEEGYTKSEILKIITVRYAMSANTYQKYIATTIATDVNEKTDRNKLRKQKGHVIFSAGESDTTLRILRNQ